MKKGYIKTNWASMLIVMVFVIAAILVRDFWISMIALVSIGVMVVNYRRFDEGERMAEEWWNSISKDEKIQLREKWEKQ